MKVVVLTDAANRGKSAAIKGVAEIFANKPGCKVVDQPQTRHIDVDMIIKTAKGKLIAFCSGGDDFEMVDRNIKYAQKHSCDILVSASRSRGKGYDRIADFMQEKGNAGLIVKPIDFYEVGNFLSDNANNHAAVCDLTVLHLERVIEYVSQFPQSK